MLEDGGVSQEAVDDGVSQEHTMQALKRISDDVSDPCASLIRGHVKYAEACRQQSLKSTSVA